MYSFWGTLQSFTIPPEGNEQEIAAWSVISRNKPKTRPDKSLLWKWYADRCDIEISNNHRLFIFLCSLWDNAPIFFWIRGLQTQEIQKTLFEAIKKRPAGSSVKQMLVVASFLGKGTYNRALDSLGDYKEKINNRFTRYPKRGPRLEFGTLQKPRNLSLEEFKEIQLKVLNNIANKAAESGKTPGLRQQWKANDIDCFLYPQDDKYI